METSTHEQSERPVWARSDAFPAAPKAWGWIDPKGVAHPVPDAAALLKVIGEDESGRVILVWSPRHAHAVMPEELPEAHQEVREARTRRLSARRNKALILLLGGTLLLCGLGLQQFWMLWRGLGDVEPALARLLQAVTGLRDSLPLGIALLLWFALLFMPAYDARKQWREWNRLEHKSDALIAVLRFETWLMLERAPLTRLLAGLLLTVWLLQWSVGDEAVAAAGLIKPAYHAGEYWRLLTAPWLHGNCLHFIFNGLALLYLGKRLELFARWPHLLAVLSISMLAGGVCSVQLLSATSIGMSGGLLGLLGFLLVFESLHRPLVPRSARRRLLAGVLLTAVMGLIGYRIIDNAAHLGGLLAGMVYAAVVFPPSASLRRPKILGVDRLVGVLAALFLLGSASLSLYLILTAS